MDIPIPYDFKLIRDSEPAFDLCNFNFPTISRNVSNIYLLGYRLLITFAAEK